MPTLGIPYKTADGIVELSRRSRGLSQRHRTLLLLVDGRRTMPQVLELAHKAGVPLGYIDELVALGLVGVPLIPDAVSPALAAMSPPVATRSRPAPFVATAEPQPVLVGASAAEIDIVLASGFAADGPGMGPEAFDVTPSAAAPLSGAPTTGAGQPEWDDSAEFDEAITQSELLALDATDEALAKARDILLQALREEAPVAGAVTMLRVRRARNRAALTALLPEVAQKLNRQRRLIDPALIIRRVREMLAG